MGEQRGLAPLLTVDLAPVTVELNLRESGARFPCKWSSVLEIYTNCGRWFLQMPGMTYAYCGEPAPGQDGKTCREIGATSSFRSKVQNNDVWKAHQRAYKKYFARTRKGTMSKGVFEVWSRKMETLRDDALKEYGRAKSEEERQRIVDEVTQKLNKL